MYYILCVYCSICVLLQVIISDDPFLLSLIICNPNSIPCARCQSDLATCNLGSFFIIPRSSASNRHFRKR